MRASFLSLSAVCFIYFCGKIHVLLAKFRIIYLAAILDSFSIQGPETYKQKTHVHCAVETSECKQIFYSSF